MPREVINPESLFNSLQYGFSQIAVGQGSRFVAVSGQVGWDEREQIADQADLHQQMLKALSNLEITMQAAGGSLDDILLLHIYIVESAMADSVAIREALKQWFPVSPPASSWIGVPRLANPDFLVEVEALAILT
jgi:2-iminobutanoate/2-iminopropanoate deaminase